MSKHIFSIRKPKVGMPKTEKQEIRKSKKRKNKRQLSDYSKQTARQIILQYALSLILFPIICLFLFLVGANGYFVYRKITNDDSSLIFWMARVLADTLMLWAILIGVLGWLVLTWHFLCKPLRYLDEVVEASKILSAPTEAPIILSPDLKNLQDNLNLVREQALRNAVLAKEAEQRKNDLVVYLAHDLKTAGGADQRVFRNYPVQSDFPDPGRGTYQFEPHVGAGHQ